MTGSFRKSQHVGFDGGLLCHDLLAQRIVKGSFMAKPRIA
jgi:hypothetical protein